MNLNNARLRISAGKSGQIPEKTVHEVVISGKSNVGKSSLINRLLNRRNFARVSATPGKTATINFYDIDERITLVDLPGYGYAKVSKDRKEDWGRLVDSYLASDRDIDLFIQLIDIRHDPTAHDRMMVEWITTNDLPFMIICTKSDKLSKTQKEKSLVNIREILGLGEDVRIMAFSSQTGEGRDELISILEEISEK